MTVVMVWAYLNSTNSHKLISAVEEGEWDEESMGVKKMFYELEKKTDSGVYYDWQVMKWHVDDDEFDEEFNRDVYGEEDDDE